MKTPVLPMFFVGKFYCILVLVLDFFLIHSSFFKNTTKREKINMKKIISLVVGTLLLTVMTVTGANSAQTLKCQTVISAKADEVVM